MQISKVTRGAHAEESAEFEKYLGKKLGRIEKLTNKYQDDEVLLTATIEKFEKHNAYKITLMLDIKGKTIMAEESSHAITKALDDSVDRLVGNLKKAFEKKKDKTSLKSK